MDAKGRFDVVGIVTSGRVGFADTYGCIERTNHKLGIPTVRVTSPYWEQCLTRCVKAALQHDKKYLLFFDGDGIWDVPDVEALYKIIESDDTVDAVCPVQADRSGRKPLAYDWNSEVGLNYDFSQPCTPIIHGHFGLTLIRRTVFEQMPEPWFMSVPASDGSWDLKPGKRDADTYFWVKLYETLHDHGTKGRRVLQANYTVVGHLELHVRWQVGPDVVIQTLPEYYTHGPPYGLRNPRQDELTDDAKNRRIEALTTKEPYRKPALGTTMPPNFKTNQPQNELPPEPQPVHIQKIRQDQLAGGTALDKAWDIGQMM